MDASPRSTSASDPRLSELRLVEWELAGAREARRELVPASEVEHLCAAVLSLHHEPGRNPHSAQAPAALLRLSVGRPRLEPGFWWTAPSLSEAGPRARLVAWAFETRFDAGHDADPPDPV